VLLTSKLCYEFINLPDFRQFDVENEPAGKNWSGSYSDQLTRNALVTIRKKD